VHPDGCQDEWALEAEVPGQLPEDERPSATGASDAWVAAHPDARMDAEALQRLAGVGAEKWAAQAQGGRGRDALSRQLELQPAPLKRLASAALCTRAADQSGARSCAARESGPPAQQPVPEVAQQNEAPPLELAGSQKQQLQVQPVEARTEEALEQALDALQERSLAARQQVQLVSPPAPRLMVSLPKAAQLQQARLELSKRQAAPRASAGGARP